MPTDIIAPFLEWLSALPAARMLAASPFAQGAAVTLHLFGAMLLQRADGQVEDRPQRRDARALLRGGEVVPGHVQVALRIARDAARPQAAAQLVEDAAVVDARGPLHHPQQPVLQGRGAWYVGGCGPTDRLDRAPG